MELWYRWKNDSKPVVRAVTSGTESSLRTEVVSDLSCLVVTTDWLSKK